MARSSQKKPWGPKDLRFYFKPHNVSFIFTTWMAIITQLMPWLQIAKQQTDWQKPDMRLVCGCLLPCMFSWSCQWRIERRREGEVLSVPSSIFEWLRTDLRGERMLMQMWSHYFRMQQPCSCLPINLSPASIRNLPAYWNHIVSATLCIF